MRCANSRYTDYKHFLTQTSLDRNSSDLHVHTKLKENKNKTFTVRQWGTFTGRWFKTGSRLFTFCEFRNCEFVTNSTPVEEVDAVLIHVKKLALLGVPQSRKQNQLWIALNNEPPTKQHIQTLSARYEFNATSTHNTDSDIPYPYGFTKKPEPGTGQYWKDVHLHRNKNRTVAWVVSHCYADSRREAYVAELQKHVTVDVFGRCGTLECPEGDSCMTQIERNYKFYLSFENSISDEYLTEKVWQAMKRYLVPVVLGGANYSKILPPNSYIDVANFTSPKALAGYLKQVAGNMDLYRSYFEWKRHYFVKHESAFETFICSMCEYMNNISSSNSIRIVPSFNKFWDRKKYCKTPGQYFSEFIRPSSLVKTFV